MPDADGDVQASNIFESLGKLADFRDPDPEGFTFAGLKAWLRVPTWLWFDKGMNRATARRAFAATLPPEIVRRSSKGTPDSFLIEIYEANLPAIREMLLGGLLSAAGLLDRPLLERALANSGPVTGHDYFRLMRLLDAEAWVRAT